MAVVLSATERMLVEKQKMEIKRMRMTKEQLELFRYLKNMSYIQDIETCLSFAETHL